MTPRIEARIEARRIQRPQGRLPIFIPPKTVAELLGYASVKSFYACIEGLEDNHAFPVPARQRRGRCWWRSDEVLAWLDMRPKKVEGVPDQAALAADRIVMLRMARAA